MGAVKWRLLRGALASLVLALGLGAAAIAGARYYLQHNEDEFLRQRAKLDGVARLYRTAENDRSLYSQYVSRFEALEREGVIGEEPRLTWVESLQRINEALKLPVLRYEIAPQTLIRFQSGRLNSTILRVYRSSMSLQAGLLHEGDLVALFGDLRRMTSGRFEVRDCDLALTNPVRGIALDRRVPNVMALCTLDWFTLKIEGAAALNEQAS